MKTTKKAIKAAGRQSKSSGIDRPEGAIPRRDASGKNSCMIERSSWRSPHAKTCEWAPTMLSIIVVPDRGIPMTNIGVGVLPDGSRLRGGAEDGDEPVGLPGALSAVVFEPLAPGALGAQLVRPLVGGECGVDVALRVEAVREREGGRNADLGAQFGIRRQALEASTLVFREVTAGDLEPAP